MNFITVLECITRRLDEIQVRYALIGGFAMAMRGVQRATMDLDLILAIDDLFEANSILLAHNYRLVFKSENVSHYSSADSDWGRIDILHAFRVPSLSMLERADRLAVTESLSIPVVQIEDIIGLKLQAMRNDPRREEGDSSDIRLLLQTAAESNVNLNWTLIADYFKILSLHISKLEEMKAVYVHYKSE